MRRTHWLALSAFALVAAAPAPPTPLKPGEGGIVGGWSDPDPRRQVRSLLIARIEDQGGCLRFAEGGPSIDVEDHLTLDKPAIWKVRRVRAGRYAIWGVGWGNAYGGGYMTTSWFGASRQHGALVTFDVPPGQVVDIGVWSVNSPYPQRYVVGAQDNHVGQAAAEALAVGVGPLTTGRIVRAEVVESKAPCPPTAVPP